MQQSVWMDTAKLPSFDTLSQEETAEVLVIGGGMAGILCAYHLKQAGIGCLLVESNTIGSGTTCRTTAVLSAQHLLYLDLVQKFGEEKAKGYLNANLEALNAYRELCANIDCDYEEKPSYIYARSAPEKIRREVDILHSIGFDAEFTDKIQLPIDIVGAVKFPGQAQFHPLKFLAGIASGLNIREHTQVWKIENNVAYTKSYKIKADKIIVASHFPILNTHGMYFAKLYQKRSYVIALQNAPQYGGTYDSYEENGLYFRNYKDLLLVGGGDHRTGKKGECFSLPRSFAKEHYPDAKEVYAWATQDCMSLDSVPYIGQYSPSLPNVYVATGFNEWGMTSSMLAAKMLTDMIRGIQNPYIDVFNPSRSMLSAQLFSNIGTTLLDYVTPGKRCPHLGCALKWNALEHSWDCPCHGSRFDERGKLIDNPSTGDIDVR